MCRCGVSGVQTSEKLYDLYEVKQKSEVVRAHVAKAKLPSDLHKSKKTQTSHTKNVSAFRPKRINRLGRKTLTVNIKY